MQPLPLRRQAVAEKGQSVKPLAKQLLPGRTPTSRLMWTSGLKAKKSWQIAPEPEPAAEPEEKPKPRGKAKAKAKALPKKKAKAKAKALPKGKAKAKAKALPKGKAKAKAKALPKGKAKAKGKAKKKTDAEVSDAGHDHQRHIWLGPRKWVFEILPNQKYGCSNCRYIFGGCKPCVRPSFRGTRAQDFAQDSVYQQALAELDSWEGDWHEDAENATEHWDEPVVENDEVVKKRSRKRGTASEA